VGGVVVPSFRGDNVNGFSVNDRKNNPQRYVFFCLQDHGVVLCVVCCVLCVVCCVLCVVCCVLCVVRSYASRFLEIFFETLNNFFAWK
jgi:hypothetical protein